ncbi:hypothetical protein EJ08DRAFT_645754 [Tothia fuscella]|uniref:DUF7907 domain-containing protein n=1 Tax=Tothia fuscella TaxID=1048955 RepID=A0A9P4U3Z4_9PEZI|nr:hypothetical protein EJ08DRAFT_645754 [Tothia fuscella]
MAIFIPAQQDETLKHFRLVLQSENSTLNGRVLHACHWNVDANALCPTFIEYPDQRIKYIFTSTTINDTDSYDNGGEYMKLRMVFPPIGSNPLFTMDFRFHIQTNLYSNIALAWFDEDYAEKDEKLEDRKVWDAVFFDEKGLMFKKGVADDRDVPIQENVQKNYYRWYVCNTVYNSYYYQTLVWGQGEPAPQNPTCVKVDVRREFL